MSRRSTTLGLRQRVNDVRRWLADGLDVPVDRVWDSLREWSHRAGLGTLRDLGVARDALEPAALAASTSLIDEGQPGQPERRTAAGDAGGGVGVSAPG